MTSKEALQIMLEFTAPQGEKQHLECSEAYLKLNRDLEILDILKKSIKETGISKGDGTIILKWQLFDIKEQKTFKLFNITIKNEEDFNKIKEWLEND